MTALVTITVEVASCLARSINEALGPRLAARALNFGAATVTDIVEVEVSVTEAYVVPL